MSFHTVSLLNGHYQSMTLKIDEKHTVSPNAWAQHSLIYHSEAGFRSAKLLT